MDADAGAATLVRVLTQQIPQELPSWLVKVNGPFLSSGKL